MNALAPTFHVGELLARLMTGETTSRQVVESLLLEIDARNDSLNAYIDLNSDEALAAADRADQERAAGKPGPLGGVPIGVKDLLAVRGSPIDVPQTCSAATPHLTPLPP